MKVAGNGMKRRAEISWLPRIVWLAATLVQQKLSVSRAFTAEIAQPTQVRRNEKTATPNRESDVCRPLVRRGKHGPPGGCDATGLPLRRGQKVLGK